MSHLLNCRDMERLRCKRAAEDIEPSWKWLARAERWRNLEQRNTSFRQSKPNLGPMAMDPNTINGERFR